MSLSVQFQTLLAMIIMGAVFGAMLDTYQRFLKRGSRKRWIVFINDILFWLMQGIIIFYVLFIVNHGELRFYFFLALLCGFSAYQALLKGIYLTLLETVIRLIILLGKFLYKTGYLLIYQPIKGIWLLIITLLLYIGSILISVGKLIWLVVKWIVKTIYRIILWPFRLIWKVLPDSFKTFVGKLRKKVEGFTKDCKNIIIKVRNFFRKKQ